MSKEVLIVEDDAELCRSLTRVLQREGYATRVAHDGRAALEQIRNARPDLVLLDLLLPGMDGRAVLRTVARDASLRSIPLIVMTGVFRGRNHEKEMLSSGAKAFLEKPFSAAELLESIHMHLGAPEAEPKPEKARQRVPFGDRTVADILWESMAAGFTGALHFTQRKRYKQLILEQGQPRLIRSNVTRECLGRRLMDSGQIDETVLHDALVRSKTSDLRLGEILVQMGALQQEQIETALREQSEEKLLETFSWADGQTWQEEGVREGSFASQLEGWEPRRTILRGVERMDEALARKQLAAHRGAAVLRDAVELSADEQTPAVIALLDDLGADTEVGSLIETHARALYGLSLIGAIKFNTPPPARGKKAADPSDAMARLRSLRDWQANQTHFEILGVTRESAPGDSRRAFVTLAKQYHPDRFKRESEETQQLAAEIFTNISVAHDCLSDPTARTRYVEALQSGNQDGREIARILSAEKEFGRGEDCVRARDYPKALEHFDAAIELDGNEGEFWAASGWALFVSQGKDTEIRAEALKRLKKSVAISPRSPIGYYYMAMFHKACGDPPAAERMFRKTLNVSPEHPEATRELRLFQMRKGGGGGGRPGGLFGRGRRK